MKEFISKTLSVLSWPFRALFGLFRKDDGGASGEKGGWGKWVVSALVVIVLLNTAIGIYWSIEPSVNAEIPGADATIPGSTTTATLIFLTDTLLNKRGGYLSNDVTPPSIFLDNMPSWEFGALVQVRDLAKSLRNDMSRSQSQSMEDPDLMIAEPQFNFDSSSWMLPATESEYRKGIKALRRYLSRLSDPSQANAQFYTRADNLREWLKVVEKRLGGLSQQLSASVGQTRVNIDLAGDSAATQSTSGPAQLSVQTPWMEIDNVFYEGRGTTWALIHILRAVEVDFRDVLIKKNALVSLKQIIRELEATQETVWSPMILNGSGFGVLANHSLVMASYVSRANAAIIDLRNLLSQG